MNGMAHIMKTTPSTTSPAVRFISPKQLHQMMEDNPSAVQVVDSRSFMNYNMERIVGSVNVYCPPLVKRRFQNCLPLNTMLTPETKLTLCRPTVESIVVHDQCTDEVLYHLSQTDLPLVLFSLAQFLGDRTYLVLAGGYCRFRQEYPNLCSSHTSLSGQLRHVTRNGSPKNGHNPVSPSSHSAVHLVPSKSHHILSLTPVELLPYLYIGDAGHSTKRELLKRLGITAILNVSTSCENHFPYEFRYKVIPVEDSNNANLMEWFQDAIYFIEHEHRTGGKILVHCHGGISRSATVCLAYLMYTRQWRLNDAFDYVKSRRHMISPNANFMMQLSQFESELRKLGFGKSATLLQKPISPLRLFSFASCPDMGQYRFTARENNDEGEIKNSRVEAGNTKLDRPVSFLYAEEDEDESQSSSRSSSNTNEIEVQESSNNCNSLDEDPDDSDTDMSEKTNSNVDNDNDNDNNNDERSRLNADLEREDNDDDDDEAFVSSSGDNGESSTSFLHLATTMPFFQETLSSPT